MSPFGCSSNAPPSCSATASILFKLLGAPLSLPLAGVKFVFQQLAVTGLWTAAAEPGTPTYATTPGTRYLLERQQALAGSDGRRERARELADEIERLVGADLVAVRRQVCPSVSVALSAALLAPKATAHAVLARLPRTRDGVRILLNGPWPPYTFATVPLS